MTEACLPGRDVHPIPGHSYGETRLPMLDASTGPLPLVHGSFGGSRRVCREVPRARFGKESPLDSPWERIYLRQVGSSNEART